MKQGLFIVAVVLITTGILVATLLLGFRFLESKPLREFPKILLLIVPVSLGALFQVVRALQNGWTMEDTVGATIACLIIAGGLLAYKQQRRGTK